MDWNARYLEKDTPWDKGYATPVLDEIHARHPGLPSERKVVVPGCGPGHEARWLASHGAYTTGLDISPLAVGQAQALDPGGSVKFAVADFLDPATPFRGSFDQLWEHTCFCALDPSMREAYVAAARNILQPGGLIVGIFFINPEMEVGENGPPFGIKGVALELLWKEADFEIIDSWIPAAGFDGRTGRERVMILKKIG